MSQLLEVVKIENAIQAKLTPKILAEDEQNV